MKSRQQPDAIRAQRRSQSADDLDRNAGRNRA
jgi:hypothetical protein